MITKGKYLIDSTYVLEKCYDLLCVFFANKEIARRSQVNDKTSLAALERRFFEQKASRLLIEIAVCLRVLDDQMKKLPTDDMQRKKYMERKIEIDKAEYGLFDDLSLTLRDTCNKIIHSDIVEPHFSEGHEAHEYDHAHNYGDSEKSINWQHFNGLIRLSGNLKKEKWHVLLDIETFITSIFKLLS